jgi:hypothetical protein
MRAPIKNHSIRRKIIDNSHKSCLHLKIVSSIHHMLKPQMTTIASTHQLTDKDKHLYSNSNYEDQTWSLASYTSLVVSYQQWVSSANKNKDQQITRMDWICLNPKQTFLDSTENKGCILLKCFQTSPLKGCTITPSTTSCEWCYAMCSTIFCETNNLLQSRCDW